MTSENPKQDTVEEVTGTQEAEEKEPLTLKGAFFDMLDLIEAAVGTFFVFMLLFTYIVRPVSVDGTSMVPTLLHEDSLLMLTIDPSPKTGKIIVIDDQKSGYFTDEAQTQVAQRNGYGSVLVKRVIATGGQVINIDSRPGYGTVSVDGVQLAEPYIADLTTRDDRAFRYPFTVPEGYVFVMGDNRLHSTDSRSPAVGLIPVEEIMGTVIFRYNRKPEKLTKWTDRFAQFLTSPYAE